MTQSNLVELLNETMQRNGEVGRPMVVVLNLQDVVIGNNNVSHSSNINGLYTPLIMDALIDQLRASNEHINRLLDMVGRLISNNKLMQYDTVIDF